MATELPGFARLQPPPGGLQRLRHALEQRGTRTRDWPAVLAAMASACLVGIVLLPRSPPPWSVSDERVVEMVRRQSASGWMELGGSNHTARVWIALPAPHHADSSP